MTGSNNRSASGRDARLIDQFLEMMSAERGASRNTLEAYGRDLADYTRFLANSGASAASAQVNDVRAFLAALAKQQLAKTSAARKLSAVKQFHRFLLSEGLAKDNPVSVVEAPKLGRPLPKIMSVEEVDRLIRTAKEAAEQALDAQKFRAVRLYCMIEVLYATGMRVSELLALPIAAAKAKEQVLLCGEREGGNGWCR